jgi:hypothetical protein
VGYFDGRGTFFKSAEEATISDLATVLGRVGDGDSLAPGIAKILLVNRRTIEHIFADHDRMIDGATVATPAPNVTARRSSVLVSEDRGTVTPLRATH